MKSLFIVAERKVNDHVGEEYDSILEVPNNPTTENREELGHLVRNRIRGLWKEQTNAESPVEDPKVLVYVDAATPFRALVIDLQIIMKDTEGVVIELPEIVTNPEPTDPEARRALGLPVEESEDAEEEDE